MKSYVFQKIMKKLLKKYGQKIYETKLAEAKPSRRKIGFSKAKIAKKIFGDYGGGVVPGPDGDYGGSSSWILDGDYGGG